MAKETTTKTAEKTIEEKEAVQEKISDKQEYLYGVGRRKTAVAQVRVYKKGEGKLTVDNKDVKEVFPTPELQSKINDPLKMVGQEDKLDVTVKVKGGGKNAQAEAIRHGISRALLLLNPNFKKPLKKAGYITRDDRKKERKKPGLKRARKSPQWKKR
ncbi:MAG TPA: 30S ribosomal protein S9 [Patescibacteria group bacterium]|nr:30S ribosomal protein S9 [Patescibacteria group bacterium]